MGWTDPDVLEACIRGLDSEGLAAFVADLWAARGFETDRDGVSVTVRRGGEKYVVYVVIGRATTPAVETACPVDVVVATGRSGAGRGETLAAELNARVVDAADLTEMLRYAISRDVAADLCERHFGAAPGELTLPPRDRARRAVAGLELKTVLVVVFASLVVAVGAGAVFGLAGPGIAGSGPPDEAAATPGTVTNPAGAGPTTVTIDAGSAPTETSGGDPVSVPGVSEAGISNASRLAQAHAATVAGTLSYTNWFDYYVPANGSPGRVQYDVDVRVDGEQVSIQTSRETTNGTRSLLSTIYFDGTDRYRAENGSEEFTRLDSQMPTATPRAVPVTRPGKMIRLYLATPESTVSTAGSDGTSERYRLQGTGRPAGLPDTVTAYEMTAVVDERGFVWMLQADFTISHDGDADSVTSHDRVRLTWTYDRINSTEIRVNRQNAN